VRNAFHQAAVANEGIGVVVDDLVRRAVEGLAQQALGERHADGVGQPLPEWSGGRFDAGGDPELGVTGRLRMQLSKALQLLDRQVVAAEMQQRVEEHRPMPVGEHETVAVGPAGLAGLCFRWWRQRTSAMSAMPIGIPG
jgi:hypothetical protein